MLKDLIEKLPNNDACLELIEMFDKLLRKYARLLSYEDSYEEMRLFFIELIFQLKNKKICTDNDGYIVSYISKAVRNQYIALSKGHRMKREISFSDISEAQLIYVEQQTSTEDRYDISDYFPQKNPLSNRETIILKAIFMKECSVEKIAQELGISRQAVNQAKNRALEKIRNSITEGS